MAIPWLVVLQSVPWIQVINNAPKLADGAKKLWDAVSGRSPPQVLPAAGSDRSPASGAESIALLQSRLAAAEAAVNDLHGQMLASSELIKTLADQNTQLIARIESNRVRVAWLAGATLVCAIVAALSLTLVLVG
jgi:hypothetical protein